MALTKPSLSKANLAIVPLMTSAIASLFQAPKTTIRGIDETQDWMGPGQPVTPIAPPGTQPRGFQFMPNQNFIYTPRANEPLTGAELREASMYDMVRIIIENVCDQVTRVPYTIRLKRRPGETAKEYANRKPDPGIVNMLSQLIESPNDDETTAEFERKLVDDMLVGDFASVLIRKTAKGEVYDLRTVDGATICRYIDAQGFTPRAPDPAYAQLWYGIPMVDLTTQQLIYAPRNLKSYRLYGMSPTEQAIHYIRTGSLRLTFQEAYYTDGNIPDALQIVPKSVHPDRIKEVEDALKSQLIGQLNKLRQIKLVQGFTDDGKDEIIFPKKDLLTGQDDDYIITCLCFAFGTSKQRLMKQMNRASADASQDAAEKEGLEPYLDWKQNSIWNRLIQKKQYLNLPDYEYAITEDSDVDPVNQAKIDDMDLKNGKRTLNEVREQSGLPPYAIPEADQPIIITATGPVPISIDQTVERQKKTQDAMPKPDAGDEQPGGKTPAQIAAKKKRWTI